MEILSELKFSVLTRWLHKICNIFFVWPKVVRGPGTMKEVESFPVFKFLIKCTFNQSLGQKKLQRGRCNHHLMGVTKC